MKNSLNWFEIPVTDFDRAKTFYEAVLSCEMHVMEMTDIGFKWGFFPFDKEGVGGSIAAGPGYEPSEQGVLIYLNGGNDLSEPLARVEPAGGKVVVPKTALGANGFMAQFLDTEGNKVALHSPN